MKIKITVEVTDLGVSIQKARKAENISQKELGKYLKLSSARISELEAEAEGKATISLKQLLLLEKCLNKTLFDRLDVLQKVMLYFSESKKI